MNSIKSSQVKLTEGICHLEQYKKIEDYIHACCTRAFFVKFARFSWLVTF